MYYTFSVVNISVGFAARQIRTGYQLSNGVFLLPSEQDADGRYFGAAGLDGIYLHTGKCYQPVYNQYGQIVAFEDTVCGPPDQ